jgi:hypothetical protein
MRAHLGVEQIGRLGQSRGGPEAFVRAVEAFLGGGC